MSGDLDYADMVNNAKIGFLRRRASGLAMARDTISHHLKAFCDHEIYDGEFKDLSNRLEACLREIKAISSAIGDKADELGGAA